MLKADYDLVVLGSGPGGYVAAIRASQLGMRTAIIEQDNFGGICLNWGCIPSKSLLRNAEVLNLIRHSSNFGISFDNLSYDYGAAIDRSRKIVNKLTKGVSFLLQKNNVEKITGTGILRDRNTIIVADTDRILTSENIIIATGARQKSLPNIPIDGETILTSREAIIDPVVPEKLVIIGGGATGVEFAYIYNSYGSEVTIIELLEHLIPSEDEEISLLLERSLKKQGIRILSGTEVSGIETTSDGAIVSITTNDDHSEIKCSKVLVAIGVQGNIEGIGLESLSVTTSKGFIVVDEKMQTSVPGVSAVGDVTGKLLLAHVASAQGIMAVETICGLNPPSLNYSLMPRAIYSNPQVASFGLTESQAKEQGLSINVGKFPLHATGKALALGETDGLIKLITDSEIGEILGAHMIGAEVTEMIGELTITQLLEGTTTELGSLVHPHPTISEALKEAALNAEGLAIHI